MDQEKLFAILDSLFAYDTGATDVGIKDDELKEQLRNYLHGLSESELRVTISKYLRRFLTDKALSEGYGFKDVKAVIDWLELEMDLVI